MGYLNTSSNKAWVFSEVYQVICSSGSKCISHQSETIALKREIISREKEG